MLTVQLKKEALYEEIYTIIFFITIFGFCHGSNTRKASFFHGDANGWNI